MALKYLELVTDKTELNVGSKPGNTHSVDNLYGNYLRFLLCTF